MEFVVVTVLMVSLLLLPLQMTFFPKKWFQWIYLVAVGIGVFLAYPMAIEESYASIQATMNNPKTIGNFATLVIAEGLFGCLLSIFHTRLLFGQKLKKWWNYAFYFSGVVFIISVYYLEILLFINIHSFDFQVLAMILALFIPLLIYVVKWFLHWAVPETDLRAETKFILHLIQILFAIVLSVVVLKLPVNVAKQENNLLQFIAIVVGTLVLATVGYIYHFIKTKKIWK